jgi:Arc/MetJ-type ribon-helix-helix transcriptional regulator
LLVVYDCDMSIHLPDDLSSFVKDEAMRRGFRDPSAFVQSLIEAEQHRRVRQEVETMLLDAVSGPFTDWTDTDVEDIRRTGRSMIERRKAR